MNWLDALARRMGRNPSSATPFRNRRFRPAVEQLDRRDVPALIAPASSISGYVYADANNDGIFQSTESPIKGVTVNLSGTDIYGSAVNLTTTTDSTGLYSFTIGSNGVPLNPGTYTVSEVTPTGYIDGIDTPGTPTSGTVSNHQFVNVSLGDSSNGVNAVNYNFGELLVPPAPPVSPPPPAANSSIGGYVYLDANNDGIKESHEPPIPNVAITLTGTDISGNSITRNATTDASGHYDFASLVAGTYTIIETQPSSFAEGQNTQGTPGTGTVGTDVFSNITLAANVNGDNNNFGEQFYKSSLGGYVYVDANNDGIFQSSETPLASVAITLTGTDIFGSSVSQTTTTGSNGHYSFANLQPGTYTITETEPTGYLPGKDTQGTPGTGTVGTGVFSSISLSTGVNGDNNNFGELSKPGSICGVVYNDCNKDGVQDNGEKGIAGVTVTLKGPGGVRTATTDCSGNYSFTDLIAGSYSVTETLPKGYTQDTTSAGSLGGSASGTVISDIPVNGSAGTGYNFGDIVTVSCRTPTCPSIPCTPVVCPTVTCPSIPCTPVVCPTPTCTPVVSKTPTTPTCSTVVCRQFRVPRSPAHQSRARLQLAPRFPVRRWSARQSHARRSLASRHRARSVRYLRSASAAGNLAMVRPTRKPISSAAFSLRIVSRTHLLNELSLRGARQSLSTALLFYNNRIARFLSK